MISTSEIRVGSAFMFEGNPFIVQKSSDSKADGRESQLSFV